MKPLCRIAAHHAVDDFPDSRIGASLKHSGSRAAEIADG